MKIQQAKMQAIRFSAEDVIATSAGPLTGQTGLFYIPNDNNGYDSFNGTFGAYSNGAYQIVDTYAHETGVGGDREELASRQQGLVYFSGTPVPATVLEGIAQQTYDIFSYNNGVYYSEGVSYYEQYWQ